MAVHVLRPQFSEFFISEKIDTASAKAPHLPYMWTRAAPNASFITICLALMREWIFLPFSNPPNSPHAGSTVVQAMASGVIPLSIISSKSAEAFLLSPFFTRMPRPALHNAISVTRLLSTRSKRAMASSYCPHLVYMLIRAVVKKSLMGMPLSVIRECILLPVSKSRTLPQARSATVYVCSFGCGDSLAVLFISSNRASAFSSKPAPT